MTNQPLKSGKKFNEELDEKLKLNLKEFKESPLGVYYESVLNKMYIPIITEMNKTIRMLEEKEHKTTEEYELKRLLENLKECSKYYTFELKKQAKNKINRMVKQRTRAYESAFYYATNKFKNRLTMPTIFNHKFKDSGFYILYDGSIEDRYSICREFKSEICKYRPSGSERLHKIPDEYKIELEGILAVDIGPNDKYHCFRILHKDAKPMVLHHTSAEGSICMGTMGTTEFHNGVSNALINRDWESMINIFDEVSKLTRVVYRGGAYNNIGLWKPKTSELDKKLVELNRFLRREDNESNEDEEEEESNDEEAREHEVDD